jgi:predicted ATPase
MIAHRLMGNCLFLTGDIAGGRAHLDQAMALYDPAEHRPLATRFAQDVGVGILCWRALASQVLGYPESASRDAERALKDAREIDQAATLMYALGLTSLVFIACGNYTTANTQSDELVPLADEKGALLWKALGMMNRGWILALTGKASDATQMLTSGITSGRSLGATLARPTYLSHLAQAHVELSQHDEAWRCIGEAMTMMGTTKEKWYEAEIHRIVGDLALLSPEPDATKAQAYFERALAVARQQQAKSWELRAAMSLARLWRDQGKVQQARELLAPVYGWFTEGHSTRDLQEAKRCWRSWRDEDAQEDRLGRLLS